MMIWSASDRAMPTIVNAFVLECQRGFEIIKARHCGIVLLAAVHRHGSVWMQGPCLRSVASQLGKQYNRQQAPRPTRAVTDAGQTAQRSGGAIGAWRAMVCSEQAARVQAPGARCFVFSYREVVSIIFKSLWFHVVEQLRRPPQQVLESRVEFKSCPQHDLANK